MSNNRIKKFRETWEDDEWGSEDSPTFKRKEKSKQQREKAREQKLSDRWYDDDMKMKRKKK
jgi:hypothetical protein